MRYIKCKQKIRTNMFNVYYKYVELNIYYEIVSLNIYEKKKTFFYIIFYN